MFDVKRQEFEFHNPDLGSCKYWPGDLGLAATHIIIFARLLSNGTDHGVHPFFIQIRDIATHKLLPGVEALDIGPKLGYATKDNGFLRLTRFRAPKSCLLNRYISIDVEGKVKKIGNPRRMYTGMMRTRAFLLINAYVSMFKAVTIATRYSLFRTQFKDSKGREISIFNYQMQREKLLREISRAYVMNLGVNAALKQIKINNELSSKDDFSQLQSTHLMLCCMKALYTNWQVDCF